jgi:hypothetical protein
LLRFLHSIGLNSQGSLREKMGCLSCCLLGITQPFIQLFEQPGDQTRVSGFAQPNANRTLTFEDLERLDVAYDQELTVSDLERIQVNEIGEMVGLTAVLREGGVILSDGKLPTGYGPI